MIPPNISAAALLAIKNTISLYCVALDTQSFHLLNDCFSTDIKADYAAVSPQNPKIEGLEDFIERIKVILDGKITQHALSTQMLDFESDGKESWECKAVTYFTANTFVMANRDGQKVDHVSVFGMYRDRLVEEEPGKWKIVERTVKTFVSFTVFSSVFSRKSSPMRDTASEPGTNNFTLQHPRIRNTSTLPQG